jgi:hypothetical protein
MKKEISKLIFFTCIFFLSPNSKAQNQLSFSSVLRNETSFNFIYGANGMVRDTISVPAGYVLKVEGSSVLYATNSIVNGETFFTAFTGNGSPSTITIDRYTIRRIDENSSVNLPLWLGPGDHIIRFYWYAASNASSQPINGILSINGLLFKVDP